MSDLQHAVRVRASSGCVIGAALLGFAMILIGLALELYIYDRYALVVRDLLVVINGWWLAGFGAIFVVTFGGGSLLDRRDVLTIDSSGIRAPRHGVDIPLDQIQRVRLLTNENDRIAFLAVHVFDANVIQGAAEQRKKYNVKALQLDANTIPFGLAFLSYDEQELMTVIDELNSMERQRDT